MYKLCALGLLVCFAVLVVVSAYPLVQGDVSTYQDGTTRLRIVREAFADPRRFRPGFGFGGGQGFGNSAANANSFSAGFNSPFGGFQTSGSSANAFGSGGGGHFG